MADSDRAGTTADNSSDRPLPAAGYGPPWEGRLDGERSMAISYGVIAAVLVFGAIGYFLDRRLHTEPWLLLAGLVAGLSLGFVMLGRLVAEGRAGR